MGLGMAPVEGQDGEGEDELENRVDMGDGEEGQV